jgi:hypothetical protein
MEHMSTSLPDDKALLESSASSSASSSGMKGWGNRRKTIETWIGGLSITTKQGGQHTPFVGILMNKLRFYKEEKQYIPIKEAPYL